MSKRRSCNEPPPPVFDRVKDLEVEEVTLPDYRRLLEEYQVLYAEQSPYLLRAKTLITKLYKERFGAVLQGSIP